MGPAAADAEAALAAPFLAATPRRVVLSVATDLWGVQPAGWIAASLLFVAFAAGGAFLPWRVAPPSRWPDNAIRIQVVFEEPALMPAASEMAALAAPVEPPSAAAPADSSPIVLAPETASAEVEPEPSPIATAPALVPLPKPPARKPPMHRGPPPHAAAVESVSTAPAVQTAQVAAAVAPAAHGPTRPPSLAYGPKPDYPAAARMRGLQGRVLLHIDIAADGTPANVSVATSSGHPVLDRIAMTTVLRNWRFHPALREGIPVASERDLPVEFRLED